MMNRDYGKEIDGLKEQIEMLKDLLSNYRNDANQEKENKPLKNIDRMDNMHPDKRLAELMKELCEKADQRDSTGAITYLGVYSSGGRQSNWIRNQVDTNNLLKLIESNTATKVLACIGNNDRLKIMLAILRGPKTVAHLVEECGYNTTGQVYHHLKPLLAADIIKEEGSSRGVYAIQPHRVQGILMLLAGISDLYDPKYTQGNWELD